MNKKLPIFLILLLISQLFSYNAQANIIKKKLYLTTFPFTAVKPDSTVIFSWVNTFNDANIPIDSTATFAFSPTPGGDNIYSYQYKITGKNYFSYDGTTPKFSFIPGNIKDNNGNKIMEVGVFYYIIYLQDINGTDTTLYISDQLQLIVESKIPVTPLYPITSKDNGITELVPIFSWEPNPGVPYYHLILSDEPIVIDQENNSVSGISAIWQVITPSTSIQYGSKDPSGQFSDIEPPPLSPGNTYNWIVLNNYGNTIYTSSTVVGAPVSFTVAPIAGLKKPINIYPNDKDSFNAINDSIIIFKWTNGGTNINSYELYLYVTDSISGIEAKINVWKGTTTDTSFTLNAKKTLYNKTYFWKVYAIDKNGNSIASDFTSFKYSIPMSYLTTYTYTTINDSLTPLPYVSLKAIPISGSADIIPFGTDNNGKSFKKPFLVGKYKIVATKNGYISNETIVDLSKENESYTVSLTLNPSPATIYGKVIDENSAGIGEATVIATYDQYTIETITDSKGSYSLNLPVGGLWTISVQKSAYNPSTPIQVSIANGQAIEAEDITLQRAEFQVFGTIYNVNNQPIKRVNVAILDENNNTYEEMITGDDGAYNFFIPYGKWKIKASLTGFTTQIISINNLSTSNQIDITLQEAGQILGTIYRTDYSIELQDYNQPSQLTNAKVIAINTSTNDTNFTTTDAYGKYSLGVKYGTYKILASASNCITKEYPSLITVTESKRTIDNIDITLISYADLEGYVYNTKDSSTIKDATITLTDLSFNQIKSTTSKDNGSYLLENIPDGKYLVYASKKGYTTSKIDTLQIKDGKILKYYNFYIFQGNLHSLTLKAIYNNQLYEPVVNITSPFYFPLKSINKTYHIDSLSDGNYTIEFIPNETHILPILKNYTLTNTSPSSINDSVEFKIIHINKDTIQIDSKGTITLNCEFLNNGSFSGYLYYRKYKSNEFNKVPISINGKYIQATLTLQNGGYILEYYFEILDKLTNIIYSNKKAPFYSYIMPVEKLEYISTYPSLPDTSNVKYFLANQEINFEVLGYFNGKVSNHLIEKVEWYSSDPNYISFENKITDSRFNKLFTLKATAQPINIKIIAFGYNGEKDSLIAKIAVIDGTIDTAYIKRMDVSVDNKYITNDKNAIFKVFAKITQQDSKKTLIELPVNWSVSPQNAVEITGDIFKFKPNFAGQLKISTSIYKYGNIYYNNSQNIRENNRHLIVQDKVNPPDTIYDYKNLTLIFKDSCFINTPTDIFTLTNSVVPNSLKSVKNFEIASDIYNFTLQNNSYFTKPVSFIFNIPSSFRNRDKYALGYYNDSLLSFEIIDTNLILVNDSTLMGEFKHFSTYAIFASKEPLKIKDVHLTPNPFSPLVFARDNNQKYPGLGIKFYCSTQYDPVPTIKIEIFTLKGVKVWERKESPAPVSGYQEFYWDGKYMNSNKYVPNGRYIVKITAKELSTGKIDTYKDIIVLIK